MAWTSKAFTAYWSKAVTKITAGGSGSNSSTSKPFSLGIWMSRNIRSGFNSLTAFTAWKPLAHSPTTSMCGCAARCSRSTARARSSSSTMMTRNGAGSSVMTQPPPPVTAPRSQGMVTRTEYRSAASLDVQARPAHRSGRRAAGARSAGRSRSAAAGRSASRGLSMVRTSVSPAWATLIVIVPPSSTFAIPCVTAFSTSGCSISGGTRHAPSAGSQSDATDEPRAEAHLLDVQVLQRQRHLVGQPDQVLAAEPAAAAQVVAQHDAHPAGGRRIGRRQRAHRVQRIEQEVRIDLRAQRPQFGFLRQHLRVQHLPFGLRATRECRSRCS